MRNTHKFSFICGCMTAVGIILIGIGYAMGGILWGIGVGKDGLIVNSPTLTANQDTYLQKTEALDSFRNMEVSLKYGDLIIETSDHFEISYSVSSEYDFSARVTDGCLTVVETPKHRFIHANFAFFSMGTLWGPSYGAEYVKILIPADTSFDRVVLKSESGDIKGCGFMADTLEIHADYGDVSLETVKSTDTNIALESCDLDLRDYSGGRLAIHNEYGDINLQNILTEDIVMILESTDTSLSDLTASSFTLENEYGDIRGSRVSADDCKVSIESGDCSFGQLTSNNVEIRSEFGDVDLGITNPLSDYMLNLAAEFGTLTVNKEDMGTTYKSLDTKEKQIAIDCESGDISLWEEG